MPLVSASNLAVHYGVEIIFSAINLDINERARIGIVGPNGGGKTSLLRVLVGQQDANEGRVVRSNGIQVGYVPQHPESTSHGTLREEVLAGFQHLRDLEQELETASQRQASSGGDAEEAGRAYAALLERYESLGGYSYEREAERMVDGLGLKSETLDSPAASASGGERTRAALAKALLGSPDLLVLDEPTNYLDLKGVTWLERYLSHFAPAVVVVSHDRYFLDQMATQIWELDHGRLNTFPGNFTKYRTLKAERDARQLKEYEAQQEFIAKEQEFIDRYRAGQRSREAKGRETRLARLERIERPDIDRTINLSKATATRTGQAVLTSKGLQVGYTDGGETVKLLDVPDLRLERGSRTAVIGDNGTGKSTFIKTVLGEAPPLGGSVGLGMGVKIGYYSQGLDTLADEHTVLDSFLEIKNLPFEEARSYLARFLFQGEDVFREVGVCSGGEKSRLALARLLITEPNLLVLDEPTTHFDIHSREAMEAVLMTYPGTILLVSHDRQLVSLLAETLLVTGGGKIDHFLGTFAEWTRAKEEAESAAVEARARERSKQTTIPKSAGAAKSPRRRNPAAPVIDFEGLIIELEDRLKELETQLQEATMGQDLEEMTRLAEEHAQTQAELDQKLEEWEE
ncbi:MAG TPA: ABC transporter ATP-binding protein [Dehalococcoidia bacterium]|nr:ABC-F family ATP-binding cassette domain-containing protein [SAR202 cluster bacterium]HAA94512.1 ABC transporter ATP-binding protein [Dehalococcoidia bacterium]|tara:strand:+ start:804 stop:2690 length:1887 start_codon:yes stop_codon:yes gene_type:complete